MAWSADPALAPRTDPYFVASTRATRISGASANGSGNSRSRSRTQHAAAVAGALHVWITWAISVIAIDGVNTPELTGRGQRLRGRQAHRGGRAQPLSGFHADLHRGRRRAGWSGPCRSASQHRVRRRALCQAGRRRLVTLLDGQHAAHDRGRSGHRAAEPQRCLSAADDRRVRSCPEELVVQCHAVSGAAANSAAAAAQQTGSAPQKRFADAHDAAYWAASTRGYDWSQEDRIRRWTSTGYSGQALDMARTRQRQGSVDCHRLPPHHQAR